MLNALHMRSITGNNNQVENALAAIVVEKVNNQTAITSAEKSYLREKLRDMQIPDSTAYIPTCLRILSPLARLTLVRNLSLCPVV
jgi:hypothetical protein